jgi:hypothetical protein
LVLEVMISVTGVREGLLYEMLDPAQRSWPLLQEGIPGDDYCATFLFDHGRLRAAMTYHNLRSFPARRFFRPRACSSWSSTRSINCSP